MSFVKTVKKNHDNDILLKKIPLNIADKFLNSDIPKNKDIISIIGIDTETTGLNHEKEHIIEIGLIGLIINKNSGEIIYITDEYSSLNDPGVEIPSEATQVNHITNEMVKGENIDWDYVDFIIKKYDYVLAHNAKFDRAFLSNYSKVSESKIWCCTQKDIDWKKRGFVSDKLELLSYWHGFYYDSHRAINDVEAMFYLISNEVYYEGNMPIMELIKSTSNTGIEVRALHSNISKKDILKENKYFAKYINGKFICWYKKINKVDLELEKEWLEKEVYEGPVLAEFIELTILDRHK